MAKPDAIDCALVRALKVLIEFSAVCSETAAEQGEPIHALHAAGVSPDGSGADPRRG
jgi:hypothetical protein